MISVAVVGLGRVGSRNDTHPYPAYPAPLSHVGAALVVPRIRLVGMVDPDPRARAEADALWGDRTDVKATGSLDDIGHVDVVALCTPTRSRLVDVRSALALAPRVLVVEKPLAWTADEGRRIVREVEAAGCRLLVNFNRRFDPGSRAFRESLPGTPRKVVLRYGKGLMNYGSHLVDLLIDWGGSIRAVQALGVPEGDGDPALSFRCAMARGFDAVALGFYGLAYDQFEAEFYFNAARFDYLSGGSERRVWRPVADRIYKGYAHLAEVEAAPHAEIVGGFRELYAALCDHLSYGAPLAGCGPADAIHGLDAIGAALRSAKLGGAEVALPGAVDIRG